MPNLKDDLISVNLTRIHQRIAAACRLAGRSDDDVLLLAVSKTRPASDLRIAFAAGQSAFGENYLQEALAKQDELGDLNILWHFIGPIQSNKTRAISENFDWVHSVDRVKIAQRLNEQRPAHLPPLNICLQVNLDGEESKSGLTLAELPAVAAEVMQLPRLRLRGLMAIPAVRENPEEQRQVFDTLRGALEQLTQRWPDQPLDTLSIGMSADMEAAIAAGATIVRIGTDIFGARG